MIPKRLLLLRADGDGQADEAARASWINHHPDWQVTAAAPTAELQSPGAGGLEWVCQGGGVVVSPGWRARRSLDDLLVDCEAVVATFHPGQIPAVWGAVAGHPACQALIKQVRETPNQGNPACSSRVFELLTQRPDVRGVERDVIVDR